jgi:hypothetical protein
VQVVESADQEPKIPLELELRDGRIIRIRRGFDPQALRELLAALEEAR